MSLLHSVNYFSPLLSLSALFAREVPTNVRITYRKGSFAGKERTRERDTASQNIRTNTYFPSQSSDKSLHFIREEGGGLINIFSQQCDGITTLWPTFETWREENDTSTENDIKWHILEGLRKTLNQTIINSLIQISWPKNA